MSKTIRLPDAAFGAGTPPFRLPDMVPNTVSSSPRAARLPILGCCGAAKVTIKGLRSPAGTANFMLSTLKPAAGSHGCYAAMPQIIATEMTQALVACVTKLSCCQCKKLALLIAVHGQVQT